MIKSMFSKLIFSVFFLLNFSGAFAQKTGFLTGTWEGDLGDDEFVQINFIQTGNKVCGYTWDYLWNSRESRCKANFTGYYNKFRDRWFIRGTTFIMNSGTHSLMEIMFEIKKGKGKRDTIEGFCRAVRSGIFSSPDEPQLLVAGRVSYKPEMITPDMDDCVAANQPLKRSRPVQPSTPPRRSPAPKINPPVRVPVKRDTGSRPTPVTKKIDSAVTLSPAIKTPAAKEILPLKTAGRINKETGRTVVKDKKIVLYIYDNAVTDGDSVSIYYNNRLIADRKRLSEKPIVLELNLDENVSLHSISMVALNLGTIPPNTALVVFTDSAGKRHELFSKATLNENALLVFEYKPD